MKNGDRYELNSNKDFDRRKNLTVKEISGLISRNIANGTKTLIVKEGYDIKYVSRFEVYNVDELIIIADAISSLQLLEGF